MTHVMWVDADDDHVLINTEVHRAEVQGGRARPPGDRDDLGEGRSVHVRRGARPRRRDGARPRGARAHIDALRRSTAARLRPAAITSERVILRIAARTCEHDARSGRELGDVRRPHRRDVRPRGSARRVVARARGVAGVRLDAHDRAVRHLRLSRLRDGGERRRPSAASRRSAGRLSRAALDAELSARQRGRSPAAQASSQRASRRRARPIRSPAVAMPYPPATSTERERARGDRAWKEPLRVLVQRHRRSLRRASCRPVVEGSCEDRLQRLAARSQAPVSEIGVSRRRRPRRDQPLQPEPLDAPSGRAATSSAP